MSVHDDLPCKAFLRVNPDPMSRSVTKAKPAPRPKGRPETNETVGREALLDAAIEELRVSTPETLTLVAVAARAGVHPALIRYYFGNKDKMLREVVRRLVDDMQEAARATMESDAPIEAKLRDRIGTLIQQIQDNPHFHRLILDKIYSQGKDDKGEDPLGVIASRGMRLTVALLHDQPSQPLRRIDPRFLHVALIGLSEFFVSAAPLLRELFGEGAELKDLRSRYISFVTDLVLHGITADSPKSAND